MGLCLETSITMLLINTIIFCVCVFFLGLAEYPITLQRVVTNSHGLSTKVDSCRLK